MQAVAGMREVFGQGENRNPASGPPRMREVEKREVEVLLMVPGGEKRWKQRKSDYMKRLEDENKRLTDFINDYNQRKSSLKAQNDALHEQLSYFKTCLTEMAPMMAVGQR